MLTVAGLGRGRADYYLADLGDELRRVVPGQGPAALCWTGRGAAPLGLAGPVPDDAFRRLLEGRPPGAPAGGNDRRSVAALDLTFSAPKALSVLFALGSREAAAAVLDGHRHAVRGALAYLETRALSVRRQVGGEREVLGADGLVGACVEHCLSRASDPHLHTHVVAANAVHGADGRWRAIDGRGLHAHAPAAGALYEAHLRGELTRRLGLRWVWRDGAGWEPEGTDPVALAAFSGRRAEIKEAVGTDRGASGRIAWAATRDRKDRRPADELRRDWRSRSAVAGGWRPPHLGRAEPGQPGLLDEYRFAAAVAARSGALCRRDVVAAWAGAARHGHDALDVDRAVEWWVPAEGEVGVGEASRAPAAAVPARHLLQALGPRPLDAAGQPRWLGAARALDAYRERWGVRGPVALGEEAPARFPALRLAEHLEVERAIREARSRPGVPLLRGVERGGPGRER